MTPEQLQMQFDALVLAGEVTAEPETLVVWQQVQAREPVAWREMMEHVVLAGGRDLLVTLARQCDTGWGCRTPLGGELIGHVQTLVDEVFERRR